MTSGQPAQRIPTLDGWRAVAIIAVIACHSRALFAPDGAFPNVSASHLLGYLRQGVDLFFAISGFLITRLLSLELTKSGRLSLSGFYIRRVFRILPLIFLYLSVTALIGFWRAPIIERWEVLSTLLFLRNYAVRDGGTTTAHFWSLSVEEHFYLLWPPLLSLVKRSQAIALAGAVALAIALWRGIDARYGIFLHAFSYDPGPTLRTDTRLDALLWGAVAALAWDRLKALFERLRRLPLAPTLVLALIVINARKVPLAPTLLALLFPMLIASTVFCPGTLVSRVLEARALRWLGRLSYSLYVWQTLFLQTTQVSFSRTAEGSAQLPRYLLDISLILACSIGSHYLLELPLQRLGRRLGQVYARRSSVVLT